MSERPIVAIILASLLAQGCGNAPSDAPDADTFAVDREFERGPLRVRVRVDKNEISMGDNVKLEVVSELKVDE